MELHVVIDHDGVKSVQIVGPAEAHPEGHELYFLIRHLIPQLDKEIQKALRENSLKGGEEEIN